MAFFDKYLQPGRSARKPAPQMSVPKPTFRPPAPTMSVAPKPYQGIPGARDMFSRFSDGQSNSMNLGGALGKAFPQAFGGSSSKLSTTSYGNNVLQQPSNFLAKPVVVPKPQPQMSVAPPRTLEQMQAQNQALRQSQGRTQGQVQASSGPVTPPKPPVQPSLPPPPQQNVLGGGFSSVLDPMDPAAIGGALMNKRPELPRAPEPTGPKTQDEWLQRLADENPELADQIMDKLGYGGSPNGGASDQLNALRKQYLESLGLSPDEIAAQGELSGISSQAAQESARARKEYADRIAAIQDQATLQPFLTGRQLQASGQLTNQLEALQAATEAQTMPLQSRLAALQAQRQMEQRRRETELGFAESDIERQDRLRKESEVTPVEVGGRLVDPRTGRVVFEPPAETAEGKTFTLSPGQRVYNAQGQLIAENPEGAGSDKFTNVSPGSTVIDSLGNVVYRAPKEGEGADAKAIASQVGELDTTIGLVDEIVNNPAFKQVFGLSGAVDPRNYIPGSAAQYLKSQIEQLKAFLALENRQKLKGQGTISDREFKVLTDAATALNAKLGDQDALRELTKLRDALTGRRSELSSGGSGGDITDIDAFLDSF